jgi:hypothetical protein
MTEAKDTLTKSKDTYNFFVYISNALYCIKTLIRIGEVAIQEQRSELQSKQCMPLKTNKN